MMNFGKLETSAIANTNELVLSAGYLNLDFSLVKFAAPPEYQGISGALSQLRRTDAEDGQSHITARRLGALFDGICPPTPNLIKAYGTRATQIAQTVSSQGTPLKTKTNWIFSEYLGVDATSLWAAATSRKAALPVHLLACMLARIWNEAEAVSIWVEIVADRRAELRATFDTDGEIPFEKASAASQAEISREQLAKWDASARAWLQTADTVHKVKNDQLLLIIKNISLSVSNESTTYRSIMSAWTSALKTMESLIAGAPHVVRNGAVLLGLSSWHIYPNMIYIGGVGGSQQIHMNDPLVNQSGVMTLGVSDQSHSNSSASGIYWSLSLAHHRFYGRPEIKRGRMDGTDHRLTFLQLQQATIGAILSLWKVPVDQTEDALRMLAQLASFLLSDQDPASMVFHWIRMMTEPILEYFNDEAAGSLAVSLGRRRSTFISESRINPHKPFWGLNTLVGLLENLTRYTDDIELHWRLVKRSPHLQDQECLIIWDHDGDDDDDGNWCYISANPDDDARSRVCWAPDHLTSIYSKIGRVMPCAPTRFDRTSPMTIVDHETDRTYDFAFGDVGNVATFVRRAAYADTASIYQLPDVTYDDIRWAIQHDMLSLTAIRNKISTFDDEIVYTLWFLSLASTEYRSLAFEGATISPRILRQPCSIQSVPREALAGAPACRTPSAQEMEFLFKDNEGEKRLIIDLTDAVATLIAYLETGEDILSRIPPRVLGLSTGNSLYVPREILLDPQTSRRGSMFCRLLGNLGTSGFTLLTCPSKPMCRDIDEGSWRQSTTVFDGSAEDYFTRTSLHLTLTDWSAPLHQIEFVGRRHAGGTHREAVVSVRDAGRWVADIDPQTALEADNVEIRQYAPCSCEGKDEETSGKLPVIDAQALQSWDQVMDCPEGILVTQSHKNWMARLALVSVLAQHSNLTHSTQRIIVCPSETCWKCVKTLHRNAVFIG